VTCTGLSRLLETGKGENHPQFTVRLTKHSNRTPPRATHRLRSCRQICYETTTATGAARRTAALITPEICSCQHLTKNQGPPPKNQASPEASLPKAHPTFSSSSDQNRCCFPPRTHASCLQPHQQWLPFVEIWSLRGAVKCCPAIVPRKPGPAGKSSTVCLPRLQPAKPKSSVPQTSACPCRRSQAFGLGMMKMRPVPGLYQGPFPCPDVALSSRSQQPSSSSSWTAAGHLF